MDLFHRVRVLCVLLAWTVVATLASVADASDEGQAAAAQISELSYRAILGDNQGAAGILYAHDGFQRRYTPEHDLARANIVARFQSYGLTVTEEPFTYQSTTYYNVVATKTGTVHPLEQYIVGAHFDTVMCPGADDNGSGTALVLEVARILSRYPSDYTIRFIAFDREEEWMIGSQAYVAAHAAETVLGMISADMVSYDSGTNQAQIYGYPASDPVKNAVAAAVSTYGGGLTYTLNGALDGSDHAPFEWQGYQACLLIEDHTANPNYHTEQDSVDTPNYINYPYAVRMTKAVTGYLVDHALVRVATLGFGYPDERPITIQPAGGTRMRVVVSAGLDGGAPQPGTAVLHYDLGGGWQAAPMDVISDNVYDAVFPGAACGQHVPYYVTAEMVGGLVCTDPPDAPGSSYVATAAYAHDVVILQDDMEIDHGWTVGDVGDDATTGFWSRNVPQVTDAQPGEDHTPAPGTMCWVTDYRAGAGPGVYDVDDGKTTLKSPIFDLTDYVEVRVGYWRWYSNDAGNAPHEDVFKVDITNDNGGTWVNVETVGPTGDEASGGWYYHEFFVADFVTPTSQVQLRFVASDETNPSLVEAVVDDFLITAHDCHVPCPNPLDGDMDGSGSVDGNDIQAFVSAMLGTPTEADLCHGDFTGDGSLDPADVSGMVSKLLGS